MNVKPGRQTIGAILAALALGAATPASLAADASGAPVISITAKRYDFTPNTITLKRGEPVTLRFTSEDRTHGFLVKPLGIDMDIAPGKSNDVTIRPDAAGTYTAICDHYCGLGHGGMKMTFVVQLSPVAARGSRSPPPRAPPPPCSRRFVPARSRR